MHRKDHTGVSATASLLDAAVKHGFIDKRGAWFTTETEKIGQGRENAKQYLRENPEVALEIENQIRSKYDLPLNQGNIKATSEQTEE